MIILIQGYNSAAQETSFDKIAKKMEPAVAKITGYMRNAGSNREFSEFNRSSGIIFDDRGFLFTVYTSYVHRMSRILCEKFKVELSNGRIIKAEIFSVDPLINLAILKINSGDNFPMVDISQQGLFRIGEPVAALFGKGFDKNNFYIKGVIKARNKTSMYGAGLSDLLIDIDMLLPDYAFGGPLINEKGELIGMNMHDLHRFAAPDQKQEGHALPISLVHTNFKMLMAFPTFEQPWLGMSARALSLEEAAAFYRKFGHVNGLFIDFVWQDGPAGRAQIKAGDILLSANGKKLRAGYELDRLLVEAGVRAEIDCKVFRYGSEIASKNLISEKRPPWAAP